MKIILKYFALFIIPFLLTTCKKYPDGGYERRGPKMLLKHNGAWTLTLYEVNGIDSTELINYNGDNKYKEVSFAKENTHYSPNLYAENFDSFSYIINFSNNNTKLSFNTTVSDYDNLAKYCYVGNSFATGCYRLFFNPEGHTTEWEIIKLTKKELILTCSQVNQYKLKFKCR